MQPCIDYGSFLTYNPVRMQVIRKLDLIIRRTTAHVPVSGDRKSGIPAEVLTPDDDS